MKKYAGRHAQALRMAVVAAYGLTCHLCGEPIASMREFEVDHLIAQSVPGSPAVDLANLRPAHGTYSKAKCNQRRGNTTLATYRTTRPVDNVDWFAAG